MKKVLFFLSIVFISFNSFTVVHKFYVSVTQIEYNDEQQSLQIISRIFIDDLEKVLTERYDTTIELTAEKDSNTVDQYLNRYLSQRLTITIDGKDVRFKFIGKEYEDDLVLCYLEVENITALHEIEVSNTTLMDVFEDQQNIIHVKHGDNRKSLILEKEKNRGVLKFSE